MAGAPRRAILSAALPLGYHEPRGGNLQLVSEVGQHAISANSIFSARTC
jgi:hypothetical protein